jgi:hypothetical protein
MNISVDTTVMQNVQPCIYCRKSIIIGQRGVWVRSSNAWRHYDCAAPRKRAAKISLDQVNISPRKYWWDDANCAGAPLDYFFDRDDVALNGANTLPGKALCEACTVSRDCLLDALITDERRGMRAGFLARERNQTMRRVRGDIRKAILDFDRDVFYQPED